MKNKKILITGGCGFIGSNLAKRLITNNNVSIFIRKDEPKDNIKEIENKLEIIEGSLLDKKLLKKSIENIDILYHLAWQTDLNKSMKHPLDDINDLRGLINILETARNYNPKLKIVFASTVTVIGQTNQLPSNEKTFENPTSVYDINKLTAEKYLNTYHQTYNINTCTLRLSNVFGEGQKTNNPNRGVLNFMIGNALTNKLLTVYGKGDFIRDYCYIQNYIDAFVLAAEKDIVGVYVLGSGKGITFNEVVNKIKKIAESLTRKSVIIKHITPPNDNKINKRDFIADNNKFRKATGWYPKISFEEGLRRTIEYYYKKT